MSQMSGPLAGRRILLVEDEYFIAEAMEDWMRCAGAEVIGPVPSAAQALVLIGEGTAPPHAAVLDVNLGGGATTYPVADRLNDAGVPYVFATGEVRIADDPAYRERPRLEKPITRVQLLGALQDLLAAQPVGGC